MLTTKNKETMSDFALLDAHKNNILISGYDSKLYLYKKNTGVNECSYQSENGFVQTMESLRLKDKTLVILGFESGVLELVLYNPET